MSDHWRLEEQRLEEDQIKMMAKLLLGIVFALGTSLILLVAR
ncbi:MAG TPA: hypothetical protein VLX09_10745 [Stellaceae bacterium]|jgi:hypothetical protein|nr:hypothetical protein [Stellaceae bacterium]